MFKCIVEEQYEFYCNNLQFTSDCPALLAMASSSSSLTSSSGASCPCDNIWYKFVHPLEPDINSDLKRFPELKCVRLCVFIRSSHWVVLPLPGTPNNKAQYYGKII